MNSNHQMIPVMHRNKASFSWDKTDTFSSTFLAVIAFDSQRYGVNLLSRSHSLHRFLSEVIPSYLSQYSPEDSSVQTSLSQLFQKLFTNRNVSLNDYRKQNSRLFAENLNEFLASC